MLQMSESGEIMELTANNYFSKEANMEYMSSTQLKSLVGSMGRPACEEHALKLLKGEITEEKSTDMLIGAYVDAYFSDEMQDFLKNNSDVIYTKSGSKYAHFKQADEMIERVKRDKLFMEFMSGEHQKIFTAEMFGTKWKCKLDSYHKGKCIVDLKCVADIYKTFYVKDYGHMNFIEYWGYITQLAIYQKIVELNTGEKLPCYICAVDKTSHPAIEIIQIPDDRMSVELSLIEYDVKHAIALKNGEVTPLRCGKCAYCKDTKIIQSPITLDELTGVI